MKHLKSYEFNEDKPIKYKLNDYVIFTTGFGDYYGQIIKVNNQNRFNQYLINAIRIWNKEIGFINKDANDIDISRKMTLEEINEFENLKQKNDIQKYNL